MKWWAYSIAAVALTASCTSKEIDTTGLAARVGEHTLTVEEVVRNIPTSLHDADSVKFARNFINNWVEEQAVTLMAEKNIPDTEAIEKMVDDYRRQLLMWEYRRAMMQKEGFATPPDSAIERYYSQHSANMKLERPIIKGLYIKIPDDAKEVAEIRKLYRSHDLGDLDKLEKLLGRAVNYEYFRDTWTDWGPVEARIPSKELDTNVDAYPLTHDHLELTADGYVYFLDISATLAAGSPMPIDYARANVIEALKRENTVTYDKQLRRQLLDQAVEQGIAEIYIPD